MAIKEHNKNQNFHFRIPMAGFSILFYNKTINKITEFGVFDPEIAETMEHGITQEQMRALQLLQDREIIAPQDPRYPAYELARQWTETVQVLPIKLLKGFNRRLVVIFQESKLPV